VILRDIIQFIKDDGLQVDTMSGVPAPAQRLLLIQEARFLCRSLISHQIRVWQLDKGRDDLGIELPSALPADFSHRRHQPCVFIGLLVGQGVENIRDG
jgi:hypothetical protein